VKVTDAISARLAYFQELERATRMLNHPGEDIVLHADFLVMIERVDICLEYLQHHVSSWYSMGNAETCVIERLSRSRCVYPPVSTMSHPCHEPYQDILHFFYTSSIGRCRTTNSREGEQSRSL